MIPLGKLSTFSKEITLKKIDNPIEDIPTDKIIIGCIKTITQETMLYVIETLEDRNWLNVESYPDYYESNDPILYLRYMVLKKVGSFQEHTLQRVLVGKKTLQEIEILLQTKGPTIFLSTKSLTYLLQTPMQTGSKKWRIIDPQKSGSLVEGETLQKLILKIRGETRKDLQIQTKEYPLQNWYVISLNEQKK